MVEYLIKRGINLEIKDNKGQTLVGEATKRKRTQIAELLIKSGAPAAEEEKKEKVTTEDKPKKESKPKVSKADKSASKASSKPAPGAKKITAPRKAQ